jgi:hypothetical protein
MVSPGDTDPPVEAYWIITRTLGVTYTWYPVVGNHDLPGGGHEANRGDNLKWLQRYDYGSVNPGPTGCPTTTFSFDYQNAHLVMLNVYCNSAGPNVTGGDIPDHLYVWLLNDLRGTDKPHIFVFGHEPAFPQPDADNGRERHMTDSLNARPAHRDRFWTLLREEGVTAYFNGHTHNYSASYIDGVWQVDVGHARGRGDTGAPSTFVLVHVDGDLVTYETYRDQHDGVYDYDDIVHHGTLAPVSNLCFQDGVSPSPAYAGTRDAYLEMDFPDTNFGDATTLIVDGISDRAAILRWDIASISPGSQVLSASIVLYVTKGAACGYELYEIKRDWRETEVTWRERLTGMPWQVPGALGGDRGVDVLGVITASSAGPHVIDLNDAGRTLVQRWIEDPATNHGLIVANYDGPDSVQFDSREAAVPDNRPRLSLFLVPSQQQMDVTIIGTTMGTVGAGHVFTASVRPAEASLPITYVWQATDQAAAVHTGSLSVTDTQVFTWTLEGVKTITVTATHAEGTVTDTHVVTISHAARADFSAWPTYGIVPLTVVLTNTSSCDYTSSTWDFGDGVTSTLSNPTHTYTDAGTYTVTLTVSGTIDICTETKVRYITVLYESVFYMPLVLHHR